MKIKKIVHYGVYATAIIFSIATTRAYEFKYASGSKSTEIEFDPEENYSYYPLTVTLGFPRTDTGLCSLFSVVANFEYSQSEDEEFYIWKLRREWDEAAFQEMYSTNLLTLMEANDNSLEPEDTGLEDTAIEDTGVMNTPMDIEKEAFDMTIIEFTSQGYLILNNGTLVSYYEDYGSIIEDPFFQYDFISHCGNIDLNPAHFLVSTKNIANAGTLELTFYASIGRDFFINLFGCTDSCNYCLEPIDITIEQVE